MNASTRERLQLVRWLDGDDSAALSATQLACMDPWIHQQVLAPLAYRRGLKRYRGDYAATAIMAEMAQTRLAQVLDAMNTRDVDVALLKGVAYASDLYDDPGERAMADIDLLVPPRQRTAANAVMRRLGYVAVAESRFHHATMFQRGNNEVFDVHAAIVSPWRSRIDQDAVWQRMRRHGNHRRLNPVDETLFHFVSMARSAMLDRLIHYIDAARLLRRLSPQQRHMLVDRARQYRVDRAVCAGLYLTNQILPDANQASGPHPVSTPHQVSTPHRVSTPHQVSTPKWLPDSWLADIVDCTPVTGLDLVRRKLLLADGTRERAGHLAQWLLEQPARWSSRR